METENNVDSVAAGGINPTPPPPRPPWIVNISIKSIKFVGSGTREAGDIKPPPPAINVSVESLEYNF